MPERNGEGRAGAQRGDEVGILIGDLAAHQHGRHAIGDLHHGERHDEGGNADDGHAAGGDEAEGKGRGERQDDGDPALHRHVGDVHVIRLDGEIGDRDADRIGDRRHRQVDLGGQDHIGEAHRDDAGDRQLPDDVQHVVERQEGRAGEAEEDDQRHQREDRRDVAQLVRQEALQAEAPRCCYFCCRHYVQSPIQRLTLPPAGRLFRCGPSRIRGPRYPS